MSTQVTSKGQVTIPKHCRELLGIGPGSLVDFELTVDGHVMLVKTDKKTPLRSRFTNLRASATVKMRTDDILKLTRGDA